MSVEIREISAVPAPERILGGLANYRSSFVRAPDHGVYVMFRATIPGQRDAAKIFGHALECDIRVFCKLIRWKDGDGTCSGLEKSDAVGRKRLAPKTQSFIESDA